MGVGEGTCCPSKENATCRCGGEGRRVGGGGHLLPLETESNLQGV